MTYAVQMVTAFLGSMGFSILFNIRRTKLLIAGFFPGACICCLALCWTTARCAVFLPLCV